MEDKQFKALLRRTVMIPIVALAILASVLLWEINSLEGSMRWVDHTDQVISGGRQLIKLMIDMETGVRGYSITGQDEFLQPYNKAKQTINSEFSALNQVLSDNPAQQAQLATVRNRFVQWQQYADRMIELRRRGGAADENASLEGKKLMDSVRTEHDTFMAREEQLRHERVVWARDTSRLVTITSALLSMAIGVFLAFFTRRQIRALGASFHHSLHTAKMRAEALRESQERWSTTLRSIGDAVISTDANGKIEFMNDVAQRLTGWSLPEAEGKELTAVFNIVQELTRVKPEDPVAKVLRLGKVAGLANHTLLMRRDGTEIPIDDSAAPILDNQGQISGVVLVFHDVSEDRKKEKALRNSDRLATMGRLAATIAHEIHNPLDSVGNLLYLVGQGTQEAATREYISMATRELTRITQMTHHMLTFQREATKPIPVKIESVLDSVIALYQTKIQAAGIHLVKQIDFEGDILALPGELRQVFANLVGNAMEAVRPRGGTITMRANASCDWRNERQGLRVIVADNGPGIPADVRDKIFEPFFTTKGESGTGLGLWITSDIVRKYEGTIRMRSSTQNGSSGTCFSVFFPFDNNFDSRTR